MPPDVVTIVSTGIGVSVIAGVLSGVCYILAHGLRKKRSRVPSFQWHCVVCGCYLRSFTAGSIKVVICKECEERVCKQRCSKSDFFNREWICYNCLKQPSWFHLVLEDIGLRWKNMTLSNHNMVNENKLHMEESEVSGSRCGKGKTCVRDFIENVISTIVGGSVDDVSVSKLYRDQQYVALFERFHHDLSNAIIDLSSALHMTINNTPFSEISPSSAHTSLKQLIERIIQEAANLPNFQKSVKNCEKSNEKPETYEELLATAILNKIISKQDNEVRPPVSANVSKESVNRNKLRRKKNLELTELESTSSSSLEEYLQNKSKLKSTKYVDESSLTIQHQIEEVSSRQEDSDEDAECTENLKMTLLDIDQSNWYLQKRQPVGSVSPAPVPMLVPNPLTSAKVLIGDKEIDETSDLSDATAESDCEYSTIIGSNLIIDTNLLITNNAIESMLNNYLSDEAASFDSGVRDDRDDCSNFSDKEKLHTFQRKNYAFVENREDGLSPASSDNSIDGEGSNRLNKCEQETRSKDLIFHSQYDSTLDRLTTTSQMYTKQKKEKEEPDSINYKNLIKMTENNIVFSGRPIFEGSYSKKEKEKWNHPVDMPYNPYSKENIKKRIQSNQRYGRDYYTKQASLPSGKSKPEEFIETFWSNENLSTDEETETFNLYRAVPATATDDQQYRSNGWTTNGFLTATSTDDQQDKLNGVATNEFYTDLDRQCNFELTNNLYSDSVNWHDLDISEVNDQKNEERSSVFDSSVENSCKNESYTKVVVSTSYQDKSDDKPQKETLVSSYVKNLNDNLTKETQAKSAAYQPITVPKKLDNTLIKKIYSNPIVRSFALNNREQIPYERNEKARKTTNTEESVISTNETKNLIKKDDTSAEILVRKPSTEKESNDETSVINNFSLEFSDNDSPKDRKYEYENDFMELTEMRVVANRVGEFAKSFPNLTKKISTKNQQIRQNYVQQIEVDEEHKFEGHNKNDSNESTQISFISVKKLKEIFEKNMINQYDKDEPVHSLTARSISKQMKLKLKDYQEDVGKL